MATEAVDQTRQQIEVLVEEVSQIAKSDVAPADFYDALLHRLVTALGAVGGAVWTADAAGNFSLAYQINLRQTGIPDDSELAERHARLLDQMLTRPNGQVVGPYAGSDHREMGNPTEFLLLFGPLVCDREPVGLVEIFQRPGCGVKTQRGYLKFVLQMCELASGYLQKQQLRQFESRQSLWGQLERFTRVVHEGLHPRETAYTVANEGRRLVECDRVSVAIRRGRRCRIEAVSGQDTFDKRSNVIARLNRLVETVLATREPIWYEGETADLPPQVEEAIQEYVDESHAKSLGVLPLFRPQPEPTGDERPRPPEVVGALVVEQIERRALDESMRHRVEVVREHSAIALANALEHDELFLMPLWRAIGRSRWLVEARTLPKTLIAVGVVLAVLLALLVVPGTLEMEAKGQLQPQGRRDVFAQYRGVVTDVEVDHGDQVEQGQTLVRLRNRELQYSLADLEGTIAETQEKIKKINVDLIHGVRLRDDEKDRLAGELMQLNATFNSLQRQHELLEEKQRLLAVASPIAGQVVTWDVRNRLIQRPVDQGQVLLSISDTAGPWEVEVHMPEDKMGHVADAYQHAQSEGEPLIVNFILATDPGTTHTGEVVEIDSQAEVRGEEGNTIRLKVKIDKSQLGEASKLRPGATVTARVDCGWYPIGYVWFHDVWAFVRSKVLFRL